MIIGNEDRTCDTKMSPVVVDGHKYWQSYYVARMHTEQQGDVRVMRWVKGKNQFATMYC